jgi:6-phosphogluconolactonase
MFGSVLTAQNIPLYVGTYTNAESKGIYQYDFNTKTGELTNKKLAVEADNPSFLAISSNGKYAYAVSETDKGLVNAYSIDKNGLFKLINSVSSEGESPCHVQLSASGKDLVVSNYNGGTIAIYTVTQNGGIENAIQVLDHNVEGEKSHAHSAQFFNNNLFVADLGRDFLAEYIDLNGTYVLKKSYAMEAGAGPRHFEISTSGEFLYVINELNSTITVLKKEKDTYVTIQNISTLRDDFKGDSFCADIHFSKNEQFLYGSNRGENSIVVFKRNTKNGELEKIQSVSVEGDWPRNFTLSPDGKFMLVANQRSNNISVYSVNENEGTLTFFHSANTSAPVCLVF